MRGEASIVKSTTILLIVVDFGSVLIGNILAGATMAGNGMDHCFERSGHGTTL